jgi:hypothetical protein
MQTVVLKEDLNPSNLNPRSVPPVYFIAVKAKHHINFFMFKEVCLELFCTVRIKLLKFMVIVEVGIIQYSADNNGPSW